MSIRVDDVMKSSTGKSWRVKSGNQWYGADLDSGVEHMKGQTVNVEIKPSKAGPWLKIVGDVVPSPMPTPTPTPRQDGDMRWLPMASNTVNAAIAAGLIKEHNQIKVWVLAVKEAVEGAASGDVGF